MQEFADLTRVKLFMNEYGMDENVNLDMSLETGYLEGYTCVPPLDPQMFSSYRTNHALLKQ